MSGQGELFDITPYIQRSPNPTLAEANFHARRAAASAASVQRQAQQIVKARSAGPTSTPPENSPYAPGSAVELAQKLDALKAHYSGTARPKGPVSDADFKKSQAINFPANTRKTRAKPTPGQRAASKAEAAMRKKNKGK